MQNMQPIQPAQPGGAMMRPNMPRPMPTAAAQITPKEILAIIRRHVLMIIICTFVGIFTSAVAFVLVRMFFPKYTARTGIEVLSPGVDDPMVLKSAFPNQDIYYQFRQTKASFMRQQSFYQDLIRDDDIRETDWFKQFNNDIAKTIEDLEDHLGASAQRESNLIVVSMTCGSKKESALIVNEAMDLFLSKQRDMARADISTQLSERRSQLQELNDELRRLEDSLKQLRGATEFSEVSTQTNSFKPYLSTKLEDAETRFNILESDISRIERLVETLRIRAEGEYDEVVREQMERDPIAQGIRQTISGIEIQLASLLAKFGENHRQVQQTRDSLDRAKQDLAERQNQIADIERKSNLRNAQDQLTTLVSELETLNKQRMEARIEYKTLDNIRAQYDRQETQKEEIRLRIDELNKNIDKLNILYNNPDLSKVKSLGPAPEPLQMSSPKIIVYGPAGFMLGFMAGVGLAFAIELLNEKLRAPSDITKYIRAPLLGMIFHEEEDEAIEDVDPRLVVQQAPYSIVSECYRQLRTSLKLADTAQEQKTVLISSCGAGCGKTSVAVNTAATFAVERKKVLLIDANFRRPASTTIFPITHVNGTTDTHADYGLSNYLMSQCEDEQVIRPSSIDGLDVIDSGPMPSNPSALLGSQKMMNLLSKYAGTYDRIIIDGPPLLVNDARILSTVVDGTILVFNASMTKRGEAQRAIRELRSINANVIGVVLLGVKVLKGGYFQEIFKSYQNYQHVQVPQTV